MDLTDQKSLDNFLGATNMEKGIYDDRADFYAPYYRQMTLGGYDLSSEENRKYLELAYGDVSAAFGSYRNPRLLSKLCCYRKEHTRWYEELYKKEEFLQQVKEKYAEVFRPETEAVLDGKIDRYADEIRESVAMPIHKLSDCTLVTKIFVLSDNLFHVGRSPYRNDCANCYKFGLTNRFSML